jgi:hypothetical protein
VSAGADPVPFWRAAKWGQVMPEIVCPLLDDATRVDIVLHAGGLLCRKGDQRRHGLSRNDHGLVDLACIGIQAGQPVGQRCGRRAVAAIDLLTGRQRAQIDRFALRHAAHVKIHSTKTRGAPAIGTAIVLLVDVQHLLVRVGRLGITTPGVIQIAEPSQNKGKSARLISPHIEQNLILYFRIRVATHGGVQGSKFLPSGDSIIPAGELLFDCQLAQVQSLGILVAAHIFIQTGQTGDLHRDVDRVRGRGLAGLQLAPKDRLRLFVAACLHVKSGKVVQGYAVPPFQSFGEQLRFRMPAYSCV